MSVLSNYPVYAAADCVEVEEAELGLGAFRVALHQGARKQDMAPIARDRLGHDLVVALDHLVDGDPEESAHEDQALYIRCRLAGLPVAHGVARNPDRLGKIGLRHTECVATSLDLL